MKISREPDANILVWELNNLPIEHAKEVGGVIIHFSQNKYPVLIEILEASRFSVKKIKSLEKALKTLPT